jgi:hypothetical protein
MSWYVIIFFRENGAIYVLPVGKFKPILSKLVIEFVKTESVMII